jgi:trans-AT polyketide synthase, acyltransferase and oxidoreductase domains
MLNLRDRLYEKFRYRAMPGIGLGGGIATPLSVSAAFVLGADYVLTGSINQACLESGTSNIVRDMLAEAEQTDVAMAPSANMFEMGIRVQVLKKGTLFPQRAKKLYDLYRRYDGFAQIPKAERKEIEEKLFQNSFEEQWRQTQEFLRDYDPKQVERAAGDARHQMALVFRSYLGKSSRWAIQGNPLRKKDYQIWCGPSMGAFNDWVKGSFLEAAQNRRFETVSLNLMFGACVAIRRQQILHAGVLLPPRTGRFTPLPLSKIQKKLAFQEPI